MRVGFVGLGTMGRPIASHLRRAGHEVTVWDVAAPAVEAVAADGATPAADVAGVAAASDVVFLSLPGPPQVAEIVEGLVPALPPHAVVVDLSTNSVDGVRAAAERCSEAGAAFVDAPVSGGKAGAEAGTLSVMVGAEPDVFARVEPLLRTFGATVFHVGPSGAGALAKLVNNQIFLCACVLIQEGFVLGAKAGMDSTALLGILKASSAAGVVGSAPFFLGRTFDDAVFRLAIAEKDVAVALESARALGVPMPTTEAAHGVYRAALADGLGDKVFTATLLALEGWAGVEVPPLRRPRKADA